MDLDQLATIKILQTRREYAAGNLPVSETTELSLSEKVEQYELLLGGATSHILGVLVQLLSIGKVRLDFRDYSERLQLADRSYIMSRPDALRLVEAYLLAREQKEEEGRRGFDFTQKIIIQAPRD